MSTRTARERLALLPLQGSRHLLAIDLARYTRPAWHGWVNDHRNEPYRAAPTALRHIALALRGRQPSHLVLAGEGKTLHRTKLLKTYKAGRPPKPIGLTEAEWQVRQALVAAGVAPYCIDGLEADDVLHAAAIVGSLANLFVVILSEDKDAEQLARTGRVVIWDGDEKVTDELAVKEDWGVPPTQLAELFAIAGDSGDGIPGVAGWGPKTAAQILNSVGTRKLAQLLADGGYHWVPSKWREKFLSNVEAIRLSYDLARLRGEWLAERPSFKAQEIDPLAVAESLNDAAERMR